jgi:hypothetical protein
MSSIPSYFTKQMISDYLTKPLQGTLFRNHCNTIKWDIQKILSVHIIRHIQKQNKQPGLNHN